MHRVKANGIGACHSRAKTAAQLAKTPNLMLSEMIAEAERMKR